MYKQIYLVKGDLINDFISSVSKVAPIPRNFLIAFSNMHTFGSLFCYGMLAYSCVHAIFFVLQATIF